MLQTGAILSWTDVKHLFNRNMGNFKFNFLSQVQLESKSIDNAFLTEIQNDNWYEYFFSNFIFALIAQT